MKFNTAYDHERSEPQRCDDRFRKIYVRQISPDGTRKLVESGVEDVYDSIQKSAQGLLVNDLIRRAEAGDPDAIRPVVDSYVDLRNAPKDLLEASKMLTEARFKYDSLPAEVKSAYGNDFKTFLESASTNDPLKIASTVVKPKKSTPTLTADEINILKAQLKSGGNNNA